MAKIKHRVMEYTADARDIDGRGATEERLNKLRPSPINLMLESSPPKLTRNQGLAAEKFYKHWHNGGLVASIPSIDIARVFGGEGFQVMPRTEHEAFHRDRYRKAKEKIEKEYGPVSFWVFEQIVCYERPLTEVGSFFGHKNRTRAAQVAFDLFIRPCNFLVREWGT